MSEEKITPPDEKSWTEDDRQRDRTYLRDKFLVCDFRIYINLQSKFYMEGMAVFNFFGDSPVLKQWSVRIDKDEEMSHCMLLQLSDGRWVRGMPNESPTTRFDEEIFNGKNVLKVTICLKTKDGLRVRILRKKLPRL